MTSENSKRNEYLLITSISLKLSANKLPGISAAQSYLFCQSYGEQKSGMVSS